MFKPHYKMTNELVGSLVTLEALRKEIELLPISVSVLNSLRETSRMESIHYSTMIEGNRLTLEQVKEVLLEGKTFGRERDEKEIQGCETAFVWLKSQVDKRNPITEKIIKQLHAIVMGGGKIPKPNPYREGQNVIRDGVTRRIVYMPPEAKDVPKLMKELISWLDDADKHKIPVPLQAAILHYQFATIHPYFDGNGRTARLLATYLLQLKGYGLKGIYSLDEYYAQNLPAYYEGLTVGSHNYYTDRADSDITAWLEYFCSKMVESFGSVRKHALKAQKSGKKDVSQQIRSLDDKQRKVLLLFKSKSFITSFDIQKVLQLKPRTARDLAQKWVESGFLVIADPSKKARKYALAKEFEH